MRLGRPGDRLACSHLENDQGFTDLGGPPQRCEKTCWLPDGFDEERDGTGCRVVDRVLDERAGIEIGFVTGCCDKAYANILLPGEFGEKKRSGAALRNDCHPCALDGALMGVVQA